MIQTYKILHGDDDVDHKKMLPLTRDLETYARNTRGHELKIVKRYCKKEIRRHSFAYRIVDPWNSLPATVVTAPSIAAFKNRLGRLWEHHPIKFGDHLY